MLDTDVLCLSAVDRPRPGGKGGRASRRKKLQAALSAVTLKPLQSWDGKLRHFARGRISRSKSKGAPLIPQQHLKAILFADVVGYSKLPDGAIPPFVQHFLASIAGLVKQAAHPPIFKNSWGDALYFVFDRVQDAGSFALEMRQMIAANDWTAKGLPKQLSVRTALHAGPIFRYFDPILRQLAFTGNHVNRTARIEPITEEGQIFASQEFAALASAQGVSEFVCLYAGQKVLPKGFGVFPIYLVLRRQEHSGKRAAHHGETARRNHLIKI
ncbi:MAG: adenylate/guanylate cyclase domain-containing protein [Verrucomicrobiae bacterium]|nr:adenylate/guanylate cyclase domain-containing protein [Verrucomicrobiae bacterium]